MAAPENEHIYGVQLRESADDGSDFTNADADYRKVFLGEDGKLHAKDSSGTVTGDIGVSANPQLTTIELGHASDTTLARVSAGVVSIEGTNIVKAGAITTSGLTQATSRLLGRSTASTGAVEEITLGTNLSFSGTTLNATGGGGLTHTTQGTTSPGASWQGTRGTYLKKLTLASAGLVSSIVAHVKGDGTNLQGISAAIFADNAGTPGDLITAGGASGLVSDSSAYDTNLKISTTARDVTFPMGAWLGAGDYWFAVRMFGGGDSQILLNYTGSGSDYDNTSASTNWIDHSIDAAASGSNNYTIYIHVIR